MEYNRAGEEKDRMKGAQTRILPRRDPGQI